MDSQAKLGVVLGVMMFLTPQLVYANPIVTDYYNVCGVSDGYKICASSNVTWDGSKLIMRVWNMEGMGNASLFGLAHTMTSVGLTPNGANDKSKMFTGFQVLFNGTDVSRYWGAGANPLQLVLGGSTKSGGSGHTGGIVGCTDPVPGHNHLQTCGQYPSSPYLEFTFTGFNAGFNYAAYNTFEYHSQHTANNAGSMKVSGPPNTPPPTEVVPEPITMILVGSGLLGVGGAAARKRRREAEIESA